jgi:hypothetical protein
MEEEMRITRGGIKLFGTKRKGAAVTLLMDEEAIEKEFQLDTEYHFFLLAPSLPWLLFLLHPPWLPSKDGVEVD